MLSRSTFSSPFALTLSSPRCNAHDVLEFRNRELHQKMRRMSRYVGMTIIIRGGINRRLVSLGSVLDCMFVSFLIFFYFT